MTGAPDTHQGGCLCGAVRYRVEGPLRDVVVCHCSRCRRAQGHVAAYSDCPTTALTISDGDGALRWYLADERARGFCARCGASLFWRSDEDPATTAVAAGTLDEPTGLRTVAQIYTATPGDYYESAGEGDRFAEGLNGPPGTR